MVVICRGRDKVKVTNTWFYKKMAKNVFMKKAVSRRKLDPTCKVARCITMPWKRPTGKGRRCPKSPQTRGVTRSPKLRWEILVNFYSSEIIEDDKSCFTVTGAASPGNSSYHDCTGDVHDEVKFHSQTKFPHWVVTRGFLLQARTISPVVGSGNCTVWEHCCSRVCQRKRSKFEDEKHNPLNAPGFRLIGHFRGWLAMRVHNSNSSTNTLEQLVKRVEKSIKLPTARSYCLMSAEVLDWHQTMSTSQFRDRKRC